MFMAAVWDLKKKTVFGAYQIKLRLRIFEKLKLANFFISKPCFLLQIWSL